ncbi:hypothetical protein V495_04414 [Pseudogymnoascus sp. VKM F-4514 (FW-929)]|nr:hypothetical protein V495_04414 [Pseudogymnoascus sp. VKM F-4514 (FW-929)]KFY57837.1 hypothetical protein V497_05241 [Pseudogymnoascus sp. VKM F-4516 (FW-969)]
MTGATKFLYTNFDSAVPSTSDYPRGNYSSTSPEATPSSASSNHSPINNALLRRVHTKSRRGCLNCKRRRIKCPENHPDCTQCTKRGLTCEWPEIQIEQTGNDGKRVARAIPRQVDSPNTFSIEDFRLFNHFITECHPSHPLGNEEQWTHAIPSIAHNHEYLLHAMLALAASDISECNPNDTALAVSGMNHRVRAIETLSTALSRGVHTMEEGNAMLATCYTLVFQSALIADGFPEYMSFIRGCMVVAWQMGVKQLTFLFQGILSDEQLERMGPHLKGAADIDPVLTNGAIGSLEACRPLVMKDAEMAFHQCLLEIVQAVQISSRQAYIGIMKIYAIFAYNMSAIEFHEFIHPDNQVGLLLQAHMIAIQVIMEPVFNGEDRANEDAGTKKKKPWRPKHAGSVAWLNSIEEKISDEMAPWFAWPIAQRDAARARIAEETLAHSQALLKAF